MNVKLLRKIKKEILAEPLRFDMHGWFNADDRIAPCKSTACIAGWTVALDHMGKTTSWKSVIAQRNDGDAEGEARRLLKLDFEQANRLFFIAGWPREFHDRYWEIENTLNYRDIKGARLKRKQLAQIAAERIDHFIKTGGEE